MHSQTFFLFFFSLFYDGGAKTISLLIPQPKIKDRGDGDLFHIITLIGSSNIVCNKVGFRKSINYSPINKGIRDSFNLTNNIYNKPMRDFGRVGQCLQGLLHKLHVWYPILLPFQLLGKQPWFLPIVGSASFFFDNSCIKVYFHKNGEKEIP